MKIRSALMTFGAAALLASCAARINVTIQPDGAAGIVVDAEIPSPVAGRMASFRDGPDAATAPLFNAGLIRKEAAARGIGVVSVAAVSKEKLSASFSVKSLADLTGRDTALADSGLLSVKRDASGGTIRFDLTRKNAKYLPVLFPGIDPYVLEALSPPAVEDAPITMEEYRSMLESLFGSRTMPAIDATEVEVVLRLPGAIVASEGGVAKDSVFMAKIPVVAALVLENPIHFSVTWKQ